MTYKNNDFFKENIKDLRDSIDNLDASLIYILTERFKCTDKIGKIKALTKISPVDEKRENEQRERLENISKISGLSPDITKKIFKYIVDIVVERHKNIANIYNKDNNE